MSCTVYQYDYEFIIMALRARS